MNSKLHRTALSGLLLSSLAAAALAAADPPKADTAFRLVPEMQPPTGILYQSKADRGAHQKSNQAQRSLSRLSATVHKIWPRIREIDLVALARYQIEATQGFVLPAEPDDLVGQIIGWDEESRLWHLELRGPRLPAKYDIVHRYLYFYATFDPASEKLSDLVVTIRGWVLE